MKIQGLLFFGLFFFLTLFSCQKSKEYPIEPVIEMSSRQALQNPSKIIVSFTDGDGDIGFHESDTMPPYNFIDDGNGNSSNKFYYNLLLIYFEKNDGLWEEIETLVPYSYRVPYITPTGQNKALNGEIEVDVVLPGNRPDSIRFDIELIDRALHESNRLTTPVFYK
jgi:hypothetical protein